MHNSETYNFSLNTIWADRVSTTRNSVTWFNIDFSQIISPEVYLKYPKFNITLNQILTSNNGSTLAQNQCPCQIYIGGLPWNSSYINRMQSNYTNISGLLLTENPTSTLQLNRLQTPFSFYRPTQNTNITIQIMGFNGQLDNSVDMPDAVYYFTITPVKH